MFCGITELIVAILLLFRKTRMAGALIGIFVMANVVAINFSYDISVKVYSCFLLLLCFIIISPNVGRFIFFIAGKTTNAEIPGRDIFATKRAKLFRVITKAAVIGMMLISTLTVYFRENNFNDDVAQRPKFNGAWDVMEFIRNGDTLQSFSPGGLSRWEKVFIHRRGYFITQDMFGNMNDYELLTDTVKRQLIIKMDANPDADEEIYRLDYEQNKQDELILHGNFDGQNMWARLRKLDLSKLRALRQEFNWTIDQ